MKNFVDEGQQVANFSFVADLQCRNFAALNTPLFIQGRAAACGLYIGACLAQRAWALGFDDDFHKPQLVSPAAMELEVTYNQAA